MEGKELLDIEGVLEPETVAQFFPMLDSLQRQKLYVMKVLKESRAAYEDMDVFENVVLVLNDISPDVTKMEGCKPHHIWKAVEMIKEINSDIELSHEILMYIKMICKENGLEFYPENIGLKQNKQLYKSIVTRSKEGPFPLGEDFLGIQAARLLKIQNYLGE
tara:strand:- start:1454 stop:1939 length:486 start_codon:yes stop_codon:yes gene_type:complete